MSSRPLPTRRQAILACAFVALTALTCAGLVSAAVLVPAPPDVVPFIVATCIGFPMLATWQLSSAIAVLRAGADMRRFLRQLPETQHPLDL